MRRRKRNIFRWVALGLTVAAAVPAAAQAKPTPYQGQHQVRQPMELGLSEGKIRALGLQQTISPEDLSVSRATPVTQVRQPMELGLSEGKIRALGLVEQRSTQTSDGRSYSVDVNAYTVTGFGVVLFIAMAIGMGIVAARHNRGTKLSPA